MKTRLLTIVCTLLLLANHNLWAACVYEYPTQNGTINISSVYNDNVCRIWDINMGQAQLIKINYNIDIESDYDYIYIYSINDDGEEDYEFELTGLKQGSITTVFPNGKARIVFYTDGSVNYHSDDAFGESSISFTIDTNSHSASNLFLSDNAFINGKVGIGMTPSTGRLGVYNNVTQTNTPYGIYSSSNSGTTNYGNAYGTYSAGSSNGSNGRAYGTYSNANAYGTNSTAYGLYANAYGSATGSVYGIYSNVNGAGGAGTKWSGYFTGGQFEIRKGSFIIGEDAQRQFIFHPSWQVGDPAKLFIAPRKDATGWDWEKQIILTNDGSLLMSAGRLGVGTTTPQATLDVAGDAKIFKIQTQRIDYAFNDFFAYDQQNLGHYSMGWYTDSWNHGGPTLWQSAFGGMKFFTQGQLRFAIKGDGNIGIGTANPTAKLDVAGTIRANEVKINLNGGADFVFEDNYKLMNLSDLDEFVSTNKHLPDVAPAAEMVSNGVDMGEFQIKLLQKIEELTLYVIEQDKRILEQQKEINSLKAVMQK